MMRIYGVINSCIGEAYEQLVNIASLAHNSNIAIGDVHIIELSGNIEDYRASLALKILESECNNASMILFPGSDWGRELAIRVGSRLGGVSAVDIISMNTENTSITRKAYAGNLLATYRINGAPWCFSIDRSVRSEHVLANDISVFASYDTHCLDAIKSENDSSNKVCVRDDTGNGLEDADFVLACGQGIRNKDSFDSIIKTGEALGATVGASRPVAMNAWIPMSGMLGVSGSMIHPKVCIVAAASGSPAFFAGIEHSQYIIAINTDRRAPIMSKCDLAIVDDAREVIDKLALPVGNTGDI